MTRPAIFLLQETGLTPFLHAEIGMEENGGALTMLSLLARLGQDPWAEAGRLERMPHAAVTRHLAGLIRQMPLRLPLMDDAEHVAARLSKLLPSRTHEIPDKVPDRTTAFLLMVGLCIGLSLALMFMGSKAGDHAPAESGIATKAK